MIDNTETISEWESFWSRLAREYANVCAEHDLDPRFATLDQIDTAIDRMALREEQIA